MKGFILKVVAESRSRETAKKEAPVPPDRSLEGPPDVNPLTADHLALTIRCSCLALVTLTA